MQIETHGSYELRECRFQPYEPIIVNDIDEKCMVDFCKRFHRLEKYYDYIPIVIDSHGGMCYSLLGMAETILASRKTVITYLRGKGMSAGALLTCMGTDGFRFMGPNSYMMLHQMQSEVCGPSNEVRQSIKHLESLEEHIFHLAEINIGKPKGYLLNKIKKLAENSEWYIDAKTAKRHNIINHIGNPRIELELKPEYRIIY